MNASRVRILVGVIAIALLVGAGWWWRCRPPEAATTASPDPLSVLGRPPVWSELDAWQESMGADEFGRLVREVFTVGDGWQQWLEIGADQARVRMGGDSWYRLRLKDERSVGNAPRRYWRTLEELPAAPVGRPLQGLHIAIDPGHIGGEWAKMEERWFAIGNQKPVCEGDMTLQVAEILKPLLEGLGAKVSLVRSAAQPVTPLRPDQLLEIAARGLPAEAAPSRVRRAAERLFYRTAEIHARADQVNQRIQPDLVLCLHFNAEGWGDPNHPTLVDRNHFHLLLNGAYAADELAMEDQRFAMVRKILSRTHVEEARLGESIAEVFQGTTGMPPFLYPEHAPNARQVNHHPCLWARNLLANRLYDCPVVFMEPYVMNAKVDYARIQAGDFLGLKEVAGSLRPSIFREYAESLCAGLVRECNRRRGLTVDVR